MAVSLGPDLGDGAAVLAWACRAGVLSPGQVVDERLTVTGFRGRNDVFVVDSAAGRLVLKRFRQARDAAAEVRAHSRLERTSIAPHLLRLVARDGLLVVYESPEGVVGLGRRLYGARPPNARLLRGMGRVLGGLHGCGAPPARTRRGLPWILGIADPAPVGILAQGVKLQRLVADLQARADVARALDRLAAAPGPRVPCHNDVKWENWLVAERGPLASRLRLIDLEHAGPGPAAWDVGSVLANLCELWVDAVVERALGFREVRQLAAALAAGYAEAGGTASSARCVAFAGARLLQTVYESVSYSAYVGEHAHRLLEMAAHLLTRPESAAVHLFGLDARAFRPRD
ncbi:MAG TPA: aminoglycoside phosphotransferase family protein [Thermoleophilaceae bacterium]